MLMIQTGIKSDAGMCSLFDAVSVLSLSNDLKHSCTDHKYRLNIRLHIGC